MDIQEHLMQTSSKEDAKAVADFIGNDAEKFATLVALFLNKECRIVQRAAWVVSKCADQHPELIAPHLETFVGVLSTNPQVAVKRNVLRVLQDYKIPAEYQGELADICFKILESPKEAVAVKVFGMTVLKNIALEVQELKPELRYLIEKQLPYSSKGFQSRGKKILKAIE